LLLAEVVYIGKMIYVIGVNHYEEQFPHEKNNIDKINRLQNFVRKVCKENNIQLIAEEWRDEVRELSVTGKTYIEELAPKIPITYFPCDLNMPERKALGIKSRPEIAQELGLNFPLILPDSKEEEMVNNTAAAKAGDTKREEVWLERILARAGADKNVLLVCGYEHADSFVKLAKNNGHEAQRLYIS
jgi:hypothetical protein